MKVNKDYIAGLFENLGCFSFHAPQDGRIKYPLFRLVVTHKEKDKIKLMDRCADWMKKNEGIELKKNDCKDRVDYNIHSLSEVNKMLDFLEKNCFLKKKRQEEMKKFISDWKKAKEKMKKMKEGFT